MGIILVKLFSTLFINDLPYIDTLLACQYTHRFDIALPTRFPPNAKNSVTLHYYMYLCKLCAGKLPFHIVRYPAVRE